MRLKHLLLAATMLGPIAARAQAPAAGGLALGTTAGTAAQGNDSRIVNAIPTSTLNQPNGPAQLDGNGKVLLASLTNRPSASPLTTTVGTTATTILPAGSYSSIVITPITQGAVINCTDDGSTPALGTGNVYFGLQFVWPNPPSTTPVGAIKCIASATMTITVDARL